MRKRYYVGVRSMNDADVFLSAHEPTQRVGDFVYAIGPFQTLRGARRMVRAIRDGATHLIQTVYDAERYARIGQ